MIEKIRTTSLALMLIGAAFAAFGLPTASAHDCADHYECDATACEDGEDHHHVDYNDDTEDGECKSTATPPPDDESCEYYGLRHPPLVCKLLGETGVYATPKVIGSSAVLP